MLDKQRASSTIQVYAAAIAAFYAYIDEINSWMCQNFLQLNKEKTEVIAFGNKDEVLKVNAYLDSRGQTTKNQVRNLGVILETDLVLVVMSKL